MTLAKQSECRQLPVRLCDIKPLVRLTAARRVAASEPAAAVEVLAAALHPSQTTYWVHESALPVYLQVVAA